MGGMSIESGRRIMRRGEERKESELRGRRRKFEVKTFRRMTRDGMGLVKKRL
jgi:hypothetical protein